MQLERSLNNEHVSIFRVSKKHEFSRLEGRKPPYSENEQVRAQSSYENSLKLLISSKAGPVPRFLECNSYTLTCEPLKYV